MLILKNIFSFLALMSLLPTIFLIPALVVTTIIGITKKDYTYLKQYLKIWVISVLALFGVLFLYGVAIYALSMAAK